MFSMLVIARQGIKFNAVLFKEGSEFGGIGGDGSGMFINLNGGLTLQQQHLLHLFALGINPEFRDLPCVITVRKEED